MAQTNYRYTKLYAFAGVVISLVLLASLPTLTEIIAGHLPESSPLERLDFLATFYRLYLVGTFGLLITSVVLASVIPVRSTIEQADNFQDQAASN